MATRFQSKRDIENLTRGLKESGDQTATEGQSVAEDAEQISEIHRAQFDAPTADDAARIDELQRQIRGRVESVMREVQIEQERVELEMEREASDRLGSAEEQRVNEQEYRKLYGLNKTYDASAVDQIVNVTRESIDFQLDQRQQTEAAQAKLNEEMSHAIERVRSAFGNLG